MGDVGRRRFRDKDEITDWIGGGEGSEKDCWSGSGGEGWAIVLARYSW